MKFFLAALLLFAGTTLHAQVDSMMRVYADHFPQQKAHVHFDKPAYRAGETIWFKIYLMEGPYLAERGTKVYAELVDENGSILQRKVYPLAEASAAGSFDLPVNTPASVITMRAYTTWMLNFDTAFIYHKKLHVFDRNGEQKQSLPNIDSPPTLTFFPEGGNLVAQLVSVVAIKAVNSQGLPVEVSGVITDSKGNDVTTFRSEHNGMGSFTFTPQKNEKYFARWTDGGSRNYTSHLPDAQDEGVVLSVQKTDGNVVYRVIRSDNVLTTPKAFFLVAHFAQAPVYKAHFRLESSLVTSGSIPVKDLPPGILQLTLFSPDSRPLAELIVFVNNNQHLLDATVKTPLVQTDKRAKNELVVEVGDSLLTNLSVAITDAAIAQPKHDDHIISRLLLTGDLKGYIHQPGYYFSNTSDSVVRHRDLVMMTHGWRRYKWENIVAGKLPALRYPADSALVLQARVFGQGYDRIADDEQLLAILVGKDSSQQFLLMPKTAADRFSIPFLFFDTATVYYQFQKNRKLERTASIAFQNNFLRGAPRVTLESLPPFLPMENATTERTQQLAKELARRASNFNLRGNILQTVTVTTRAKSRVDELNEKYAHGLFSASDGTSFDMTDPAVAGAQNVLWFLQGRVAGMVVNDPIGDPSVTWRGATTSLFLDEMPVDAATLATIPITDIALVKTFRPPFFGGFGGGPGGAIAVYTRKGVDVKQVTGTGLSRGKVVGYSLVKEFYSPDYSRSSADDVALDYRTTLYWNPYVVTGGESRSVRLTFYNNDVSSAFRVIVEGLNEAGKMIRIEKVIAQ